MKGIVAFAYGLSSLSPSNLRITEIAMYESRQIAGQVFTQRELRIPGAYSVDAGGQQGPIPTLRMARDAVQWARILGLEELCIVAAHPHAWRCLRDMEYAMREVGFVIPIYLSDEIQKVPLSVWFEDNSGQWHTRSRWTWYLRDTILKLMPMWLYVRIAS
jgi:hypothetical protein